VRDWSVNENQTRKIDSYFEVFLVYLKKLKSY